MTDDELEKMKIRSGVGLIIIPMLLVPVVVLARHGNTVWVGVLFFAMSAVCVFCNRLVIAICYSCCGIAIILQGYGQETLADGVLILTVVVMAGRFVLNSRKAWREVRKSKMQAKLKGNGEKTE
jgi:hypothetical protein